MKIICIGMNYAEHVAELRSKTPSEPVFFMKPDTALLRNNDPFYIPDFSTNLHYECELVVKINRLCKAIDLQFAHRCYDEIGLGIDFTARDLQEKCKANGHPWEICKSFDKSAAISPEFINKSELPDIQNINFTLEINSALRQHGNTSDMIFGIDHIISYISRFVTLKMGDLIYTGTPVGVGAVQIGDRLTGCIEGRKMLDFLIK